MGYPYTSSHGYQANLSIDVRSGVPRPLSVAMQSHGCDILSFDVLLDSQCDVFDDVTFERLLRICASGIVGYNANAPSCKEYTQG